MGEGWGEGEILPPVTVIPAKAGIQPLEDHMPKVSHAALNEVRDALERYKEVVEATEMTPKSKNTYLLHAEHFVRWLADDFQPGATLRRR